MANITPGGTRIARADSPLVPSVAAPPAPQPARPPTRDDFEVLSVCGSGEYGRVLMVRCRFNGQIYAMKVIAKTNLVLRGQSSVAQAIAESEILQTIRHPYIVSLHFAFQDADHLYLVLDYAGGGDLYALIEARGRLAESWVRVFAAELILAVSYVHSLGVVYRDLKPENVMVGLDGHLMLTDFGLAKRLNRARAHESKDGGPVSAAESNGRGSARAPIAGVTDDGGWADVGEGGAAAKAGGTAADGGSARPTKTGTICGTPAYLAPEVLKGQPYGLAVDWWTVGILIYEMATGETPFRGESLAKMAAKICACELSIPSTVPPVLASLVRGFLRLEPELRLGMGGAEGLRRLQEHPFFFGVEWAKVAEKAHAAPYVPNSDDVLPGATTAAAEGNEAKKKAAAQVARDAAAKAASAEAVAAEAAAAMKAHPHGELDPAQSAYLMLQQQFKPFAALESADGLGRTALEDASYELEALTMELSLTGTIINVSPGLLRLLKYDGGHRDEIVGRSVLDSPSLVWAEDTPAFERALVDAVECARTYPADGGLPAGEAAPPPLVASLSTTLDGAGEPHLPEVTMRVHPRGDPPSPAERGVDLDAGDTLPAAEEIEISNRSVWLHCKLDVRLERDAAQARRQSVASVLAGGDGSVPSAAEAAGGGEAFRRVVVHAVDRTVHERNKAVVARRYRWAYAQKRSAADLQSVMHSGMEFDESRTPAAIAVTRGTQSVGGFDGYLARRDRFLHAFPDMKHELLSLDVSEDGCQVVTHWAWSGTHLGEYRATDFDGRPLVMPPTGARVHNAGVSIDVLKDGRILQHSAFYDEAELRAQIMRHYSPSSPPLRPAQPPPSGSARAQAAAAAAAGKGGRHGGAAAATAAELDDGGGAPPLMDLGPPARPLRAADGGVNRRASPMLAPLAAPALPGFTPLSLRAALAMVGGSCGDGLAVVDATSAVTGAQPPLLWANRAFERMSGYSLAELRAHPSGLGALIGSDTSVAALAQLSRAFKNGEAGHALLAHYTKDGRRFLDLVTASPIAASPALLRAFRARAAASAAAAAGAANVTVAHGGGAAAEPAAGGGEAERHALVQRLSEVAARDAIAVRALQRGRLYAVLALDLSHCPVDSSEDDAEEAWFGRSRLGGGGGGGGGGAGYGYYRGGGGGGAHGHSHLVDGAPRALTPGVGPRAHSIDVTPMSTGGARAELSSAAHIAAQTSAKPAAAAAAQPPPPHAAAAPRRDLTPPGNHRPHHGGVRGALPKLPKLGLRLGGRPWGHHGSHGRSPRSGAASVEGMATPAPTPGSVGPASPDPQRPPDGRSTVTQLLHLRHPLGLPRQMRGLGALSLSATLAARDAAEHHGAPAADQDVVAATAALGIGAEDDPGLLGGADDGQRLPTADGLLLRACVEASGLSVTIARAGSAEQPLVWVNSGFEALTGYSAAEALGRNCRFLQSEATDPAAVSEIKAAILMHRGCRAQLYNVSREGQGWWNVLSLHPVREETAELARGRSAAAASYFVGLQTEVTRSELAEILAEASRWRNRYGTD